MCLPDQEPLPFAKSTLTRTVHQGPLPKGRCVPSLASYLLSLQFQSSVGNIKAIAGLEKSREVFTPSEGPEETPILEIF